MQQREYIREYNDKYRPKFNNEFFVRHDEDLIEALRKIIYSCERTGPFTIKVIGWEDIDGYMDLLTILSTEAFPLDTRLFMKARVLDCLWPCLDAPTRVLRDKVRKARLSWYLL